MADNSFFSVDDRIDVDGEKAYVQAKSGIDTLDLYDALSGAPLAGVEVSRHRHALSRVLLGVRFTAGGDIKILKSGAESDPSTGAQSYTAGPTTYSLRLWMQAFETTVTGTPSATSLELDDSSNVEIGEIGRAHV